MKRNAAAVWEGGIKDGKGQISGESGVLSEAPYSFANRLEQQQGTSPEELLAAAHAGCFSMALSLVLGESGFTPERIDTTATVTVESDDSGFTIMAVHLDVHARIPGPTPRHSRPRPRAPGRTARFPSYSTPRSRWIRI